MTELILKLFVKDYNNNISSPSIRFEIGRLSGITGIICNIFLVIIKLIGGFIGSSIAIIADALNNISDISSSLVTLIGFRMAKHPADKEHPYGHARYEYMSGTLVALITIMMGVEIVKTSVKKIIDPQPSYFTVWILIIMIISICVKLWLHIFLKSLGKKIDSTVIIASSADSRNDVIASSAVLLSCIIQFFFEINTDGYTGLAVAIFIIYSGVGIAKDTISSLLGKRADPQLIENIKNIILDKEKIIGIHDLLVHDYGPNQCFASVHVEISADEPPLICHDIIDSIECEILEKLNVHLVIHYDPIEINDQEQIEMEATVMKIIKRISPHLSIHDFRVARGSSNPKLIFDLSVPYSMMDNYAAIKEEIDHAILDIGKNYTTVIRFDGK